MPGENDPSDADIRREFDIPEHEVVVLPEDDEEDEEEDPEVGLLDEPREPPEPVGPEANLEAGIFNPPLYRQRYQAVMDVLKDEKWAKVMNKVKKI